MKRAAFLVVTVIVLVAAYASGAPLYFGTSPVPLPPPTLEQQ